MNCIMTRELGEGGRGRGCISGCKQVFIWILTATFVEKFQLDLTFENNSLEYSHNIFGTTFAKSYSFKELNMV